LGQDYHPATVVFIGGLELLQESFAGQIPSLIPDTYGDWLKSGEFIINSIYPSLTGVAGITSGMIDSVLNSADGRIAYMFAGTNIRDIRYHTIAPAVGIIAYSFEDDSVLGIIKDYGDWARTGRTLSLAEYAGLDMVSGVSITANGGATINPVAPNAYSQTAFMFVGPSLAQYIPDFTEAPDLGTIAFAAGTNPLISYPYGDWVKTGITLSVDEYPQTDGLAGITGRVINPILNSGSGQTAYMFVGDNVLLIENITNFPELGSIAYSSANSDEIFNKPGIGTWFRAGRTISEGWYNMWLSSIPSRVEMVTDPLIPQMTTNTAPSPYVATASSVASNNNAYTAFRAFDRTDNYWQSSAAVRFDSVSYTPNAEWVKIDLNTAQQAISYKVTVFNNAACWPIYWVLEGSNYSSDSAPWTSLHIVGGSGADTAQPSWSSNETKTFEIPLAKQGLYQYYRLRITRVTTDGSAVQIKELQLIPATSYRIKPITGDTLGNLAYVFVISEESE
jgi:hypothetical protein